MCVESLTVWRKKGRSFEKCPWLETLSWGNGPQVERRSNTEGWVGVGRRGMRTDGDHEEKGGGRGNRERRRNEEE